MGEALSEEELAAIRERVERARTISGMQGEIVYRDVDALLAEVDRLRAENAAMRPIVEGVASFFETKGQCFYCLAIPWRGEDHTDDCIYALARALLAKEAQG